MNKFVFLTHVASVIESKHTSRRVRAFDHNYDTFVSQGLVPASLLRPPLEPRLHQLVTPPPNHTHTHTPVCMEEFRPGQGLPELLQDEPANQRGVCEVGPGAPGHLFLHGKSKKTWVDNIYLATSCGKSKSTAQMEPR